MAVLTLKGNNMNKQKTFSLLQLLSEVAITLFVAGLVLPSLLRSDLITSEALAAGSLHTIHIAGVVLSYTSQNVEFAVLGALVGAMAACVIPFPGTTPKNTSSARTITLRAASLRH